MNAIDWVSAEMHKEVSAIHHYYTVVCYVGGLYTFLRLWKFWTVVWENTNGVHFRAVWKNTAHVQGIRCQPLGEYLIPWTSAVFSNTTLKWTPFAYLITSRNHCYHIMLCNQLRWLLLTRQVLAPTCERSVNCHSHESLNLYIILWIYDNLNRLLNADNDK